MNNIDDSIKQIEGFLAAGNLPEAEKKALENELARLKGGGSPATISSGVLDPLNMLNEIVAKMKSAGLTTDEVEQLAEKVFVTSQVGMAQLSPEIVDYIDKTKSMTINVSRVTASGQMVTSAAATMGGNRALFYVMMSDFAAQNNVYLYGPAGTGKTQMAKIVADAINYKVVVINCNQFTSPIEIVGGQTIEGYQEGKLSAAWGNLNLGTNPKTNSPYEGALLLVDELPKLDPNTAGIMNDALSTLKDPPRLDQNGMVIPKTIMNGKNEEIKLGNLFIVGTGNTLLLRPDPNYTANFAQDASLQDRFAGSTYRVYYDYELEYTRVMENCTLSAGGRVVSNINMAFLYNFLIELRESIETNKYTNEAFISMRIMTNLRDSYLQYRSNDLLPKDQQNVRPKTLQDGVASFMSLFTEVQRQNLIPQRVQEFMEVTIPEVNSRPLEALSSEADIERAKEIVKDWKQVYGDKIL